MHKFIKNETNKFSVLDIPGIKQSKHEVRAKDRANKESGARQIADAGLIGGNYTKSNGETFINHRLSVFDRLYKVQEDKIAAMEDIPIKIILEPVYLT